SRASVFYYCRRTRRYLRSFPTRRSSDLILLVAALSLVSLLVGWWSASRVMSPVSELAKRLSRSGEGGLSAPLAPRFADDEVGELAKALDDYASRLTEVVQRDREFNADVSHELRTPRSEE